MKYTFSNSQFRVLYEFELFTLKKGKQTAKNSDCRAKIDRFLSILIFNFTTFYENSRAATSNLDHIGSFSSSIVWRCQKQEKSCATQSKVKNTIKFHKIAVGDHRHQYMWDLEINSYVSHLVELNKLPMQWKYFRLLLFLSRHIRVTRIRAG